MHVFLLSTWSDRDIQHTGTGSAHRYNVHRRYVYCTVLNYSQMSRMSTERRRLIARGHSCTIYGSQAAGHRARLCCDLGRRQHSTADRLWRSVSLRRPPLSWRQSRRAVAKRGVVAPICRSLRASSVSGMSRWSSPSALEVVVDGKRCPLTTLQAAACSRSELARERLIVCGPSDPSTAPDMAADDAAEPSWLLTGRPA